MGLSSVRHRGLVTAAFWLTVAALFFVLILIIRSANWGWRKTVATLVAVVFGNFIYAAIRLGRRARRAGS